MSTMHAVDEAIELTTKEFTSAPEGWLLNGNQKKAELARIVELYFTNFNLAHGKMDAQVEEVTVGTVLASMIDLTIRDYVMGLINSDNYDEMISACDYLMSQAPSQRYANAPATIAACVAYEKGDTTLAYDYLNHAEEEYPLANLIRRVVAAKWTPSAFSAMRYELHPKVTASLFEGDKQ